MADTTFMSQTPNQSRLEAILEAVDAAIITINSGGIIVDCNSATSRMFGYPANELMGSNVKILMPEPYKAEHDGYIKSHIDTGVKRIIGSGRKVSGRHRNGRVFPVHLSVAKYSQDDQTYFAGILHDLTELDEAYSVGNRLATIVEESVSEIYTFNPDNLEFTSANRAATQNLGYTEAEIAEMTPVSIVKDLTDTALLNTLSTLKSGESERVALSTKIVRKDGTEYDAEVSLHLTQAADPPEVAVILQDVTEKNKLMNIMHRNQKMDSIGNLTGGIAHDFNNILTVMMGNLELLEDELTDENSISLLKDATESGEMGARLTQRLLAFARRSPLSPNTINVNSLISDLSEMLRRTIGTSITLEEKLSPELWECNIDISSLENALVNLAINARDAMPDGGRLLIETDNCELDEVSVPGKELEPGYYVRISVTDTGKGVPIDIRENIFEPFITSKKGGKGSGLGLSMVYGFVKQSGGSVTLYSELDKGTTFTLYLPSSEQSVRKERSQPEKNSKPTIAGKVILIAEDDDKVRALTVTRLTKLGHQVIEAEDGHKALALFKSSKGIDLVFTDVVMTEGMTGYDLAMAIRKIDSDMPVLLTSGYAEDVINAEKLAATGLSLLRKPFKLADLDDALNKLLS